ncbi:uncharacterized protein LOC131800693 isoform X2 [Musca domestica]|uniref:Uncharacterized protein LOC131800693 isoform X2 n=1 Tax=Musca domestica TaxID=7370 RepID=A0ABM3ULD0_MUSDO|nr:uncharacterized protein LOC131800693 isoform X2 [Musca domestica]
MENECAESEEKKKIGPSGGSPSNWCLYERVHGILGGYKFHNIQTVVEESIDTPFVEFVDDESIECIEILSCDMESMEVPVEASKPKRAKKSDKENSKIIKQNIDATNKE